MYIITYGIAGILLPIIQIVLVLTCIYGVQHKSPRILSLIKSLKTVTWCPLHFMLPLESVEDLGWVIGGTAGSVDGVGVGVGIALGLMDTASQADSGGPASIISNSSDGSSSKGTSASSPVPVRARAYAPRKNYYMSRYNAVCGLMMLVLLFTFGIAYTPLCIGILVNIVISTLVYQLCIHFHSKQIVHMSAECQELWVRILQEETRDLHKIIYGSRTVICIFSSMFAGFMLYDVMSLASLPAAISAICMLVCSIVLLVYAIYYLRHHHYEELIRTMSKSKGKGGVGSYTPDDWGGRSSSTEFSVDHSRDTNMSQRISRRLLNLAGVLSEMASNNTPEPEQLPVQRQESGMVYIPKDQSVYVDNAADGADTTSNPPETEGVTNPMYS